jgi:acyl dehydratase
VVATTVLDIDELVMAQGRDLGVTGWRTVEPLQLTLFAAATGGDPTADAAPEYFGLSLTNLFLPELLEVRHAASGVNYGTGSVRFPAPIRAGDRVRGRAALVDVEDVPGGVQTTVEICIEVEKQAEPACVVESLSRWLR